MAQLRITLDSETHQRLLESALAERRPVPWQAEVVLRRALGLPFPDTNADKSNRGDTQELPERRTPLDALAQGGAR